MSRVSMRRRCGLFRANDGFLLPDIAVSLMLDLFRLFRILSFFRSQSSPHDYFPCTSTPVRIESAVEVKGDHEYGGRTYRITARNIGPVNPQDHSPGAATRMGDFRTCSADV